MANIFETLSKRLVNVGTRSDIQQPLVCLRILHDGFGLADVFEGRPRRGIGEPAAPQGSGLVGVERGERFDIGSIVRIGRVGAGPAGRDARATDVMKSIARSPTCN